MFSPPLPIRRRRTAAVATLAAASLLVAGAVTGSGPAGAALRCPAVATPCIQVWIGAFDGVSPVYGSGDFDGDGIDDLLLSDGASLAFWFGSPAFTPDIIGLGGVVVYHDAPVPQSLAGTEPVVGDWDGDGRADVLWASVKGAAVDNGQVWFGTERRGRFRASAVAGTAHEGEAVPTVGDMTGDGRDDLLWHTPTTGAISLQLVSPAGDGIGVTAYVDRWPAGSSWVSGDLDGNGTMDLGVYNPRTGTGSAWFFEPGGGLSVRLLSPGTGFRLNSGDFDGDGRADLLWYGIGDRADALWYGTADRAFRAAELPLAVGGDVFPLVADLDGDGRDDVVWWDAGPSTDYVWLTRPEGPYGVATEIGDANQVVFPDIDGDGAADVLWAGVRTAEGTDTNWALWWLSSDPAAA